MPTYDYRCTKCGHRFELFHGIADDSPKRCPKCRSKAVRVPSGGAGLLFKGSGFYITDYRSKSYRDKAKQDKGGGGTPSPGGKSDAGSGSSPGGKSDVGSGSSAGGKSDSGGGAGSGGAADAGRSSGSGRSSEKKKRPRE